MSTIRDPDAILRAWLDEGPRVLPDQTARAIDVATRTAAQPTPKVRLAPRVVRRMDLSSGRTLGLAAAVGLLGALGFALVGGQRDEAPVVEPTHLAPSTSQTHTSSMYGYSVTHPTAWTFEEARDRWVPSPRDDHPGDGPYAQFDQFVVTPYRVIWAASVPNLTLTTAEAWIAENLPSRQVNVVDEYMGCRGVGGRVTGATGMPAERWLPTEVGGEPGLERDSCLFIDVVVPAGDRMFVFTYHSPSRFSTPSAERAEFDAFLAAVRLPEAARDAIAPFVSQEHGYSIRLPADWTATAASGPWSPPAPRDQAQADDFHGPAGHLTVVSTVRSEGSDLEAWIAGSVVPPPQYEMTPDGHRACVDRNHIGTRFELEGIGSTDWRDGTVAGLPARVRWLCNHTDAVVVVGSRTYVLDFLTSDPRHEALFAWLTATIEFRPDGVPKAPVVPSLAPPVATPAPTDAPERVLSTAPPLLFSEPVVSERFGYTAKIPPSWRVTLASEPWEPTLDRIHPPTNQVLPAHLDSLLETGARRIWVASAALPQGVDARTWLVDHLPRRGRAPGSPCNIAAGTYMPTTPVGDWEATKIAGRSVLERHACSYFDIAIPVEGRIYVFSVPRPKIASATSASTVSHLVDFLKTVELHPEDARDDP